MFKKKTFLFAVKSGGENADKPYLLFMNSVNGKIAGKILIIVIYRYRQVI